MYWIRSQVLHIENSPILLDEFVDCHSNDPYPVIGVSMELAESLVATPRRVFLVVFISSLEMSQITGLIPIVMDNTVMVYPLCF